MTTGSRIKLVREARLRSLEDLAEAAELSVEVLEALESEATEATPEQLWNISQELEVELGFFLRSLPVIEIQPASDEGLNAALTDEDAAAVMAQTRIWLERYLDIESFFPVEEAPIFMQPEGFPISISSAREAADAAETLREAWQLGYLPIGNVCDIVEQLGFKIGLIPGSGSFDAAAFYADEELRMPVIALSTELTGEMQRFALSRELAYFLLAGATQQTANHFAGSFLIPAGALRQTFGPSRTKLELYELQLLKLRYGIAMRRMIARLASLRIITKELMDEWITIFRDNEWIDNEPGVLGSPEIPARLYHLLLRLQAEGEVTSERAAEMIGIDEDAWESLINFVDAEYEEAEDEADEEVSEEEPALDES